MTLGIILIVVGLAGALFLFLDYIVTEKLKD